MMELQFKPFECTLVGAPEAEVDYFKRCVDYSLALVQFNPMDEVTARDIERHLKKMILRYDAAVTKLDPTENTIEITFTKHENDLQGTGSQELREHQECED